MRLSKTPTTTQALRCFSGLPLFMVNSIGLLGFRHLTFLCRKGVSPAHYRQIAVKKSKFSRRHDFPAQPRPRVDGDSRRAVPRPAGHSVHEPRAAAARPRRRRRRGAGRHPGAAWVQRAVLLQYPAVGRAVSDRAADAFAVVSRQRDDCLVHVRSVARLPACSRSCCLPRHFWSRSSRCRCSCRRGRNSARSNSSGSSSRATTSRSSPPACSANSRRANLVVFVESINPLNSTVQQRLPALRRGQAGRDHGRCARASCEDMPNGDRFIVLEHGRRYQGTPGIGRLPRSRVRAARPAHRAQRGPRAADVVEGNSDRRTRWSPTAGSSAPSFLAHLGSDFGAGAHAAGRAARRTSIRAWAARSTSLPPHSCTCSTATASTSCRA